MTQPKQCDRPQSKQMDQNPWGSAVMSVCVHSEYTVAGESLSSEETEPEPVNLCGLTCLRMCVYKPGCQVWISPIWEKSRWRNALNPLGAVQKKVPYHACVYSVFVVVYRGGIGLRNKKRPWHTEARSQAFIDWYSMWALCALAEVARVTSVEASSQKAPCLNNTCLTCLT